MRSIPLWWRFLALTLTSKLDALYGSNANPATFVAWWDSTSSESKKCSRTKWCNCIFGAEGGIRTLVWCYPQTDFESAPLWPLRYLCIYDAIVCIIYAEPCEKWLKSAALESASHIPPKRVKLACKRKVWIYSPQVKYPLCDATIYIYFLLMLPQSKTLLFALRMLL